MLERPTKSLGKCSNISYMALEVRTEYGLQDLWGVIPNSTTNCPISPIAPCLIPLCPCNWILLTRRIHKLIWYFATYYTRYNLQCPTKLWDISGMWKETRAPEGFTQSTEEYSNSTQRAAKVRVGSRPTELLRSRSNCYVTEMIF